ncbi:hypothetical protein FACS1894156_1550 [Bacteroidia bacterium]|nr:hypothetical protein FACS1894156_1550 [Bacteroidia bacterium]
MKKIIFFIVVSVILGCKDNRPTKIKTVVFDTIQSTIANEESNATAVNIVDTVNVGYYGEIIDSVCINNLLPVFLTKDSLIALMQYQPESKKEWEDYEMYGSDNDTLEYLTFNQHKIKYICFWRDGKCYAGFWEIKFEDTKNVVSLGKNVEISAETTFEELCHKFPNSCKQSEYDKNVKQRKLRLSICKECDNFWIILFENDKVQKMGYGDPG